MNKQEQVKISLGDVFEFQLSNGMFAYGRVYKNCGVGFYKKLSKLHNHPPIGSRDFFFIVPFQSGILENGTIPIIGHDSFARQEEAWPPPTYSCIDFLDFYQIHHKGNSRTVSKEECDGLEKTSIWRLDDIINRINRELGLETFVKKTQCNTTNTNQMFDFFDLDLAFEIRKMFKMHMASGSSVKTATKNVFSRFELELNDQDDWSVAITAVALLQLKYGVIQKNIRKDVIRIVNSEFLLDRLMTENKEFEEQVKLFITELKRKLLG